jgi:hypothetical protein
VRYPPFRVASCPLRQVNPVSSQRRQALTAPVVLSTSREDRTSSRMGSERGSPACRHCAAQDWSSVVRLKSEPERPLPHPPPKLDTLEHLCYDSPQNGERAPSPARPMRATPVVVGLPVIVRLAPPPSPVYRARTHSRQEVIDMHTMPGECAAPCRAAASISQGQVRSRDRRASPLGYGRTPGSATPISR